MQKKLVFALFGATGLMLTTAFSGVYGMNNPNDLDTSSSRTLVVYTGEQKPKASPTGLFTQRELGKYKHILTVQFQAFWPEQADTDKNAYLFQPNPNLVPYAARIYDYLTGLHTRGNRDVSLFLSDFYGYIERGDITPFIMHIAPIRFQAISDESMPRNPAHDAEEQSFVDSLLNPAEAYYSGLKGPANNIDGTFRTLEQVVADLKCKIADPIDPTKMTYGAYTCNVSELMTQETCNKLVKALFAEISPHVLMPVIGRSYLPMKLMVESMADDFFPVAYPTSHAKQKLGAHGLRLSKAVFSIHDWLHMQGDPRDAILYSFAESLLNDYLSGKITPEKLTPEEAISRTVKQVSDEYALFKDTLKRFIRSDHATTDAINGLFWILHEEPSALSDIFSRESSRLHMNERIKKLVAKAKKEIDSDLRDFEMERELSKMTFHSEEEKLAEIAGMKQKIDAEISYRNEHNHPADSINILKNIRATLDQISLANKIDEKTLFVGEQVKQFLLKGVERLYKDDPQMLSDARTSFAVEGVFYLSAKETASRFSYNVGFFLGFGETAHKVEGAYNNDSSKFTPHALKEAAHNIKATPKIYRRVPSLEINPDVSNATNRDEMLRFIGDVNEGLKMNVDAFASAMDAFLTSAEHA